MCPTGADEETAAAVLVGRNKCGRTPEEEAALAASLAAEQSERNKSVAAQVAARQALLASATPAEKTSKTLAVFAAAIVDLRVDEAESVGYSAIAIKAAERNRSVVINRRGNILAA
jgi:hypothetical protein